MSISLVNIAVTLLSIISLSVQSGFNKKFSSSYMKNLKGYFLFNIMFCGSMALMLTALNRGISILQTHTLITGIVFGVFYNLTILMYMKAMDNGPLSFSSLLLSCSFIVPSLAAVFLWNEKFGLFQLLGIFALLVSFYLGVGKSTGAHNKISFKWFVFGFLALIFNGILGIMQRLHQTITPGLQINEFLITAFVTSTIMSCILYFFFGKIKRQALGFKLDLKIFSLALLAAMFATVGNISVTVLSGKIPSTILFPVTNGGIVICTTLISVVFFKEKLNKLKIIGLIIGLISLVLLSISI